MKPAKLIQHLDLPKDNEVTEAELTELVKSRIRSMLDTEPEQFFSVCYRLDVSEHKVKAILASSVDIYGDLARLFIEREKTRQYYKKHYS